MNKVGPAPHLGSKHGHSKPRSSGSGLFSYSDRQLYDLVAAVARHVSPDAPAEVSQRAFDSSRASAGHPEAPSARAICMRLGKNGASAKWQLLLATACDPERNLEITEGQRQGSEEAPHLNRRHLYFALRLAAQKLDQESLTPQDYEAAREQLIAVIVVAGISR